MHFREADIVQASDFRKGVSLSNGKQRLSSSWWRQSQHLPALLYTPLWLYQSRRLSHGVPEFSESIYGECQIEDASNVKMGFYKLF